LKNSPGIQIQIIASPIACAQGIRDDWRHVSQWLASKLDAIYGERVIVKYFDMFDQDCPALPADAKLPLVKINDQVISMGGKISIPKIRQHIENLSNPAE